MLKNKVFVITGGAGLLGQHIVSSIKNSGGIPIIADLNLDHGKEVGKKLDCDAFKLDITSERSIKDLIATLSTKYGRIDGVINNAYPRNKNYGNKFEDVEYSDFCENVNLHLGGYFLVSKLFIEYFKNQGHGNILNMSSIYGVKAPRFEVYDNTDMTMPVEYSVIKSGLLHLTRYIAKYLKGKNIRCNAISLGGIKDNQAPEFLKAYGDHALNKGMLDPEDIAGTVLFLLSDESTYINGQNIIVDDGWTL